MHVRRTAIAGFFALLSSLGEAMPFSILEDDPKQWGCEHLIFMLSTRDNGAELVIPSEGAHETALVPWERHLETRVHIRLRESGIEVTHPIPMHVDALRTFSIHGIDRRRTVNKALASLRAEALSRQKHLWQVMVMTGPPGGRRRLLWRPPIDFSNARAAQQELQRTILGFFSSGGGLRVGEEIFFFLLSADDRYGLPPTLNELGYANSIFRFALARIADEPGRRPGRYLVTLIKVTSTDRVSDLLFAYDPWEDDRSVWGP